MKNLFKYLFSAVSLIMVITACEKKAEDLTVHSDGQTPVLSSSSSEIALSEADSASTAVNFSWSDPKYATDSAHTKFTLQIDKHGAGFSAPVSYTSFGTFGKSLTGKELNKILYDKGFAYGTLYDMDVRLISAYANNNEQYFSNTLLVKMSPYSKLTGPYTDSLFITGDATAVGWVNPVPDPEQSFTRVDEHTYTGEFALTGGKEFLLLPRNGDWGHKYSLADNSVPNITHFGDFGYDLPQNFKGPERDGTYRIDVDFNNAKFKITQINAFTPPDNLYIVGDATADGWNNSNPALPSQTFTKVSANVFELTVHLEGGKQYLLLPVSGNWDHKYGGNDPFFGTLYADNAANNVPAPAESGDYKITVNFDSGIYTVEKQ